VHAEAVVNIIAPGKPVFVRLMDPTTQGNISAKMLSAWEYTGRPEKQNHAIKQIFKCNENICLPQFTSNFLPKGQFIFVMKDDIDHVTSWNLNTSI